MQKEKVCCRVHDELRRIEILIPFAQKRLLHVDLVGLIVLHEPGSTQCTSCMGIERMGLLSSCVL